MVFESAVTLRRTVSARTVDPGGDDVSSLYVRQVLRVRFTIVMIIVTLLQSVLSGSSRRKFATRSSRR